MKKSILYPLFVTLLPMFTQAQDIERLKTAPRSAPQGPAYRQNPLTGPVIKKPAGGGTGQGTPLQTPLICAGGQTNVNGCCINPLGQPAEGNLNYIMYNNCEPIDNLHLSFTATTPFTAQYEQQVTNCTPSKVPKKLTPAYGVVIQYNCFSKDAPNTLIQYCFYVTGTTIYPQIQYSGGTPDKHDHDWTTNGFPIVLSKANTIPPKMTLEVDLATDDNHHVNGVTFVVIDSGKRYKQNAPRSALYPMRISEFQTNVVSSESRYVHFATGGAGVLTYSSSDLALSVEGGSYEGCAAGWKDYSGGTCETSNAQYGPIQGSEVDACSSYMLGYVTQNVTVH